MGEASRLFWSVLRITGVTRCLTDRQFVSLQYRCLMGQTLNLTPPVSFNEKLQWLKLYYRTPLLTICADKLGVRDFVRERIGERYLNDLIGVYSQVDQIDFDALPNDFVLKATHGSGWNIVCQDKNSIDWSLACRKMRKWLRSDFSVNGREWQYREIPPRILCEKFLEDKSSAVLRDYKIFAFDGVCKYIWVDFDGASDVRKGRTSREGQGYRNIYDTSWNFQPDRRILKPNQECPGVPRPECLEEMLAVAAELSRGFPQVRVDLYVLENSRVVFGEMTFSSANGCGLFIPESFGSELGSYIVLPEKRPK